VEVVAQLGSVKETIEWLQSNPSPDLAFLDIHLSDDQSFSVFDACEVSFPVVFTTAYDRYLLESFEYNSIDYLLKPVTEGKLQRAMEKMKRFQTHFNQRSIAALKDKKVGPAERIVARKGSDFIALNPDEIAYFFSLHKIVFVKDQTGRMLIVDRTLAELEEMLKPHNFFRLNRKFLAHANAIEKYRSDHGKILVELRPRVDESVHVSKETAPHFRSWIATGSRRSDG
jgi:DNA-binding LytR/AlgR family response regulator